MITGWSSTFKPDVTMINASTNTQLRILKQLAAEVEASAASVNAAISLLDEGATVPFISRYRKEITGGLTDTQLRLLEERLAYLRELEDRRTSVLASIQEQGKLTDELALALDQADTKQRLEDLYAPFKPKRRTKAQTAREAGLEPLALALLADSRVDPQVLALQYLNPTAAIETAAQALEGARDILVEDFAQNADLLAQLREFLWTEGQLESKQNPEAKALDEKFRDYFDYSEAIKKVPSHRALALLRGRETNNLLVKLAIAHDEQGPHPAESRIAAFFSLKNIGRPADQFLSDCCRFAWRVKLSWSLESEALTRLKEAAQADAIRVFAANLKDLLLAAPAGPKVVMGLDPGIRTGVKLAVVDATGKVLVTDTLFPHEPRKDWDGSIAKIAKICDALKVNLVAIGNGTASRETDQLVADFIKQFKATHIRKVVVSEAGASVYSASELASKEMPDLDVSLRGAVSIARRLQDPLAELVKIDPKAIGVGQYQHDVDQRQLAKSLDAVVEDCVNSVGVDVNTASPALLARVSGLNPVLANNMVQYRETNGAFTSRDALRKVPRLGEKTFEQAAGFLRIMNGTNPLDKSAVHPEAYPLVTKILAQIKKELPEVLGNSSQVRALKPESFADAQFGVPTIQDVLSELEKPGRDPRPEFITATFKDGVTEIKDLRPEMLLEGVVTNVTDFGAFVDIGVHQDGLVHISALSTQYVSDPRTIVKAGDVVKVKVLEIDPQRKRIALTMRLTDSAPEKNAAGATKPDRSNPKFAGKGPRQHSQGSQNDQNGQRRAPQSPRQAPANTAMANAFAKLKGG
jgi:protein Tex